MPEKYKKRIKKNIQQSKLPFINIENANKTLGNETVFGYNFIDLKETLTSH